MMEAMIYIMRTGCPWRDLPSCFGPWESVYTRFRRWSQIGLWSTILDALAERAKGKNAKNKQTAGNSRDNDRGDDDEYDGGYERD